MEFAQSDYYSTAAQVLPVILIVALVEFRFVDFTEWTPVDPVWFLVAATGAVLGVIVTAGIGEAAALRTLADKHPTSTADFLIAFAFASTVVTMLVVPIIDSQSRSPLSPERHVEAPDHPSTALGLGVHGGHCPRHPDRPRRQHPRRRGRGVVTLMDPVVTGGLLGIGGAVAGAVTQESISIGRERRRVRTRRRRAVFAVIGELLATASILEMALTRQAWVVLGGCAAQRQVGAPPRRPGRDARSGRLRDGTDLCTSRRSLCGTRLSPLTPGEPGSPLTEIIERDPLGESFFSLIWTNDRWPWADENTRGTLTGVQEALDLLRPIADHAEPGWRNDLPRYSGE